MNNTDNLGEKQQEWLKIQKSLREIYTWLGDIESIPDESRLEILDKCRVLVHNTTCFTEGTCIYPGDERCPNKRERK